MRVHAVSTLALLDTIFQDPPSELLVGTVLETVDVDYTLGRFSSSSPGPSESMSRTFEHSKFLKFFPNGLSKAEAKVVAVLITLVYVDSAKPYIHIALE